jgi:molybdopterin converting factor small subunit
VITVRLPLLLRPDPIQDTLTLDQPIGSIAELVDALEARIPGLREQLEDSVFNFAINDELILQHAAARRLADGDTVEIIPTISGGAR